MDKERRLYLRSLVVWFGPTILFLLVAEGAARVFYADAPVVMQRDEKASAPTQQSTGSSGGRSVCFGISRLLVE